MHVVRDENSVAGVLFENGRVGGYSVAGQCVLSCTLRSRHRSRLTKRKFESQQLFQDANPVSLRLQDVVLENDKNAPPKTFRTRRIYSNTMNSAGGSHLGSNSEGGIKAEQEQKPQRVANTTNNFTPIKELMANYKGLLQSGHKNKQGAGLLFSHTVPGSACSWRLSLRAFNRASLSTSASYGRS